VIAEPARHIRNERARNLQGTRAGFASRVAADLIDWVVVNSIYLGILAAIAVARYLTTRDGFDMPQPNIVVTADAIFLIALVYLTSGWSSTGRTVGKSLLGLRVVRLDGARVRSRQAFLRALLCILLWWVALPWVLVSRRNAGLHDHVVGTAVLYDWRT
jgi:uncharacterized RDD family membrane protein YckC